MKRIFSSFFSLLLCLSLCFNTVSAATSDKITDGYSSSNSNAMMSSFAEAYGWDEDKESVWEWTDTDEEGKTTEYQRQHEYQDSLLKNSYQEMVDYTLSETTTATSKVKDSEGKITEKTTVISRGNTDETKSFIEKLGISIGSMFNDSGNTYAGTSSGGKGIIKVAQSKLGVTDSSEFVNYYHTLSNGNSWFSTSDPWCAAFVTWCAGQCGYVDSIISGNVSCSAMIKDLCSNRGYAYYKINETVVNGVSSGYTPVPGDIIFYCNSYSFDDIEHVGFVQSCNVSSGEIVTIEGNTKAGHNQYGVWNRTITFEEYQRYISNGASFFGYVYIVHVPWPNEEADETEIESQYKSLTSLLTKTYGFTQEHAKKCAAAILANIYTATGCQASYSDASERCGLGRWDAAGIERMKAWYKNTSAGSGKTNEEIKQKVLEILGQVDGKDPNAYTQLQFLLYDMSSNSSYQSIWGVVKTTANDAEAIAVKCMQYFYTKTEMTSDVNTLVRDTTTNFVNKYAS